MILKLLLFKRRILKIIFFMIPFFIGINSFAQSVVSSNGGHFQNTEYQLSSTMGEATITSLEKGDIKLTQGFHQTRLTVTSVNEITGVNLKIKVYPNPTSDYLNIVIEEENIENSYYLIYNINGEILKQETIQNSETLISFEEFSPTVYFIKVFINNKEINTYKIIKQ